LLQLQPPLSAALPWTTIASRCLATTRLDARQSTSTAIKSFSDACDAEMLLLLLLLTVMVMVISYGRFQP